MDDLRGKASGSAVFTLVACSLLLFSSLDPSLVSAATTTTAAPAAAAQSSSPTTLVLTIVPPKLPADGLTYPAVVVSLQAAGGKPSLALNDTTVFLTSSLANVGSVSNLVTIAKGTGFAVANFTSSTTPGVTSISASSVGLSAVAAQVTTVYPSGLATRLRVIAVPDTQLVNPLAKGTILVETVDAAGFPAKASSDFTVTLSSSNNNVVSITTNTLTLSGGSVLSSSPYNIGFSPGTATITASASGFNSGSGTVTVQGPSPFQLKIFAQPNPMPTATPGRLVVTLTDPAGNPARAPSPIRVTMSSSNTTVVTTDQIAVIGTGAIYTVASFSSGSTPGTANLTASSPGLKSDFAPVTVTQPAVPVKLKLIVAPNPILADKANYDSIVVALTDAAGNPAVASSTIAVTLSSSNSAVGSVGGSVNIPAGSSYGIAAFASTFYVGSTFITALAQNLQSATATVNSYGPIASRVAVRAVPTSLPADGRDYTSLEVMLQDASGSPAIAPVGVPIQLASSRTDIATVNSTVVISAGQSYILTDLVTTISPGTTNITATSSGFDSSSTGFTTANPAPSQLGLYVGPASGIQSLGRGSDAIIAVQLQDSTSSPARARQDTQIVVTGSNGSVVAKPIQLDIPAGGDYAWALVKTSSPGSTTLTASTSGLISASGVLGELSLPASVILASSAPVIAIGGTALLQLQVLIGGSPLKGANVTFTATPGVVVPAQGATDSSGLLTATFVPQTNGIATITALVTGSVLGNQTASTTILVTLAGAGGTSLPTSGGLGIIGIFLPVAIVIVNQNEVRTTTRRWAGSFVSK